MAAVEASRLCRHPLALVVVVVDAIPLSVEQPAGRPDRTVDADSRPLRNPWCCRCSGGHRWCFRVRGRAFLIRIDGVQGGHEGSAMFSRASFSFPLTAAQILACWVAFVSVSVAGVHSAALGSAAVVGPS